MRRKACVALGALAALGAAAATGAAATGAPTQATSAALTAALTVSFGAATFTPAAGAPFTAAGVVGLAPAGGGFAVTLTRAADATSARLARARVAGTHFRTVGLAWSRPSGAVASLCLSDVAATSFATRRPPGAARAIEHLTLFFAAAARLAGPGACARQPPPAPVLVRLFTDPAGGLRARLDCLVARCAGALRILCAREGCPAGGLRGGPFTLGAGQERILPLALAHPVRGRHPVLTAVVTLTGRIGAIVYPVVVDPPPPPRLPTLVSTSSSPLASPSPSLSPAPGAPSPGSPGVADGSPAGAGAGGDAAPGAPGAPDGSPVGTGARDSSLTLSCAGPAQRFGAVHGVLDPSLAGRSVEIDYVPVDPADATVIHNVTTQAGGAFSDASPSPFMTAVAFYAGDDTYASADAFCP